VEAFMTTGEPVRPRVQPGTRTYTVAVMLTHVLNPTYLLLPILLLVTFAATGSWLEAAKWAGLAASIVVLPLLALIHRRVRVGVYSDSQVSVREQRHILYIVGALCTTLYSVAVFTLDAPLALKATLMALFTAGLVAMAINYFLSKVSIHTGGLAGLAMVLIILFGRSALPAMLLVPLVAWSRVALGRHTIRQVIAGALTAITVTTVVLRAYGF
jgi:membrane-associated phospholipid phosphatase